MIRKESHCKFAQKMMRKSLTIIAITVAATFALTSCGGKSDANREQIEKAHQEASEMTEGFDASVSMKPKASEGKVVMDTDTVTEIVVSEDPTSK